jgi:hypothetical protein
MTSCFLTVIVPDITWIFYRQEKEADDIQLIAARAVNTSTSAYELARDAIKQQQNIRYCERVFIALFGNHFFHHHVNFQFSSN